MRTRFPESAYTGALRPHHTASASFEHLLVSLGLVLTEEIAELIRASRRHNIPLTRLILSQGRVSEDNLYGALAAFHNLPFLAVAARDLKPCIRPSDIKSCLADGWIELEDDTGRRFIAGAPADSSVTTMRHLGGAHGRAQPFDAITTQSAIRTWITRRHGQRLLDDATVSLAENTPEMSAHKRLSHGQKIFAAVVLLSLPATLMAAPGTLVTGLFAVMTILFLGVAFQRLLAFTAEIGSPRRQAEVASIPAAQLPVYTILVPLYREAGMVERIVASVLALDYPRAKLDIKLVLEADDKETIAAALALDLPGCIEIIRVPGSFPRTKPKALNYALKFARGSFVTVYDAEDVPDPDQLRRALAAFADGDDRLACVQARLAIANSHQGWLPCQFTLEYAALFHILLSGFDRLGHPLMLGGTSNHFRIDVLRRVGAWDPYNVAEDADIGVRLVRYGYLARWLDSETREEAPDTLGNWMNQRVRWLRGWMQTYLVHMREPLRLWRELGGVRFIALQFMLAGLIVSALVHPFFLAHLIYWSAYGSIFVPQFAVFHDTLLMASAINLLVGYGVVMEISVLGLYRARRPDLLPQIFLTPFYWMLISVAAYGALLRLLIAPFSWEKTRHRNAAAGP